MNKKILLLIPVILFLCVSAALSFGQSGPPFKQEKIAAPNFSLDDVQGKTFKLSSQRGNPVIIFFGATWCPACRGEMPNYKALYDKYAKSGLKFIYIDINESTKKVARFAKENSFPYLVLVDLDGSVANDYEIIGVPTLILVDKQGNIIGVSHRTSDLPLDKLFPAKKK
jgi:cytochrome c-type biogenesis protein